MPRSQWSTTRIPDLVGMAEACEILGVHRKQIDRWCKDGSGRNGSRRTFMPPWKEVAATKIWTRRDVERLAAQRAERTSDIAGKRIEIRAELATEDAGAFMRWITWKGATVGSLWAASNDGTGPWKVGPVRPIGDACEGVGWPAGKTLDDAERNGLDLVAQRLAQDVARGIDPLGPGGFAGASQLQDEHPESVAAGNAWQHDE